MLVRREFAFKALFAKSSGSIYSLFLSEDPPANEGSQSKESTARKRRYEADISSRKRFLWLRCLEHIFCEKLPFFHKAFITVFSFLRISNFFVCIIHVKAYNPFVSAHDETRECIFAAFRMPIVDARIRRDRSTWSIYYSLFQYRRCDRQSVDVKSQFSRFILSKGIFVHFLHHI